jgi:hypothetical protein
MGRLDPSAAAGRLVGKVRGADVTGKARRAVQTLKDEYAAGARGDESPAQPIWASPREQLDAVLGLLRSAGTPSASGADPAPAPPDRQHDRQHDRQREAPQAATPAPGDPSPGGTAPTERASDDLAGEADEVAAALRGVDWARVRSVAADRRSDASRTVREMAEQVDWSKVQPVATQVSGALIAAVASGQIPVGGRLGGMVARAIVDQGGLGQQVSRRVGAPDVSVPAELRQVIETTARG